MPTYPFPPPPEAEVALRAEIDAAAAEADKGVFISAEAVDAWMETWGTEHEAPPPAPDILPPDISLRR